MAVESWMRAADADRELTVEILRQAYAEGRLEATELDERTGAAFRARTVGQLRGLIADIPRGGPPACLPSDRPWRPGQSSPHRQPAGQSQWPPPWPRAGLLMLLAGAVCVMIAAVLQSTAVIALGLTAWVGAAFLRRG